nr:FAD-dependent urate hydroxylase-like isoform X1 [Ipomoea batatas]
MIEESDCSNIVHLCRWIPFIRTKCPLIGCDGVNSVVAKLARARRMQLISKRSAIRGMLWSVQKSMEAYSKRKGIGDDSGYCYSGAVELLVWLLLLGLHRVTGFALTLWTNAWRALDALGIADSLSDRHSLPITDQFYELYRVVLETLNARCLRRKTIAGDIREKTSPRNPSDGSLVRTKVFDLGCDGVNSVVAKWLGLQKPVDSKRADIRGIRRCRVLVSTISLHPIAHSNRGGGKWSTTVDIVIDGWWNCRLATSLGLHRALVLESSESLRSPRVGLGLCACGNKRLEGTRRSGRCRCHSERHSLPIKELVPFPHVFGFNSADSLCCELCSKNQFLGALLVVNGTWCSSEFSLQIRGFKDLASVTALDVVPRIVDSKCKEEDPVIAEGVVLWQESRMRRMKGCPFTYDAPTLANGAPVRLWKIAFVPCPLPRRKSFAVENRSGGDGREEELYEDKKWGLHRYGKERRFRSFSAHQLILI